MVLGGDVRVTDRRRLGRSTGNGTLGDREASTECTKVGMWFRVQWQWMVDVLLNRPRALF